MSDAATAPEKKAEEPKRPHTGMEDAYTERVTVREKAGSIFLDRLVTDVPMCRREIGGKPVMYFMTTGTKDGHGTAGPVGSEVTEADGTVWVVATSTKFGGQFTGAMCSVTRRKKV